ncbi:MAG: hypothetical protein MMC23_006542 [Stictis urceolatum]|nr:hypothetical protein [Stictis urceolata]
MGSTALDSLPDSLATLSTARFDKLLAADSIKYAESTPENVPLSEHLSIEFRIISSLSRKPLLPSSSASHTAPHPAPPIQDQNKKAPFNPFLDPREEEIVLREVGARHRLLMNKYCTTRPMLLLTTKDFRSQSEDLHREDFEACWATLKVLDGERPYMAIYNCGPESGNSQRHKHMQCFPRFESAKLHPECKEARRSIEQGVYAISGLPYQHFISYLEPSTSAYDLYKRYLTLLSYAKEAVKDQPGEPSHNVVLVQDWIMVTPRSHAFREGIGSNATGTVGMIWLARPEEREEWERLGIEDTLEFLGVPWSGEAKALSVV